MIFEEENSLTQSKIKMSFNFTQGEKQRFSAILDKCDDHRYSLLINYFSSLGQLDVIIWLRENGCPWNEWALTYAALEGYLEVVIWLRENGCPWDENALDLAIDQEHFKVAKWLKEHGCPWSEGIISHVTHRKRLDMIKWLKENEFSE